MRLCYLVIEYFLFVSFCYTHDLNHADPVVIKQSESSVTIDPVSKNTETTNIQKNENENPRFRVPDDLKKPIDDSNQASIIPSVDASSQNDITSPSTPIQTLPSDSEASKNIPISNDQSNLKDITPSVQTQSNSQPINTTQQNQSKEEPSFIQTQSHIPSPSNSNSLDLKPDQPSTQTTTSDTLIVQTDSHPSRLLRSSPPGHHPKTQVHPRHVQTEDISITENTNVEPTEPISKTLPIVKLNVSSTKEDSNKNEVENVTTVPSFSIHDTNAHLPRTLQNENSSRMNDTKNNETNEYFSESHHSASMPTAKNRQICWRLPNKFEPSIELLENQVFRFINILPEFLQTIVFGRIDDREILMNTIWFGSICTMCFLFGFFFLSMGTKRLKETKHEKQVRARCQQLQQYNNQIVLECATFERQNQKLSEQIDELRNVPVRDNDDDIFALRTECAQFQEDIKTARSERSTLQQSIDHQQNLIQKYEYDLKEQGELVARLNNQILQLTQDLEKERTAVVRLQSSNFSLEHSEKSQEIIQELKSELTQLKQDKFTHKDQLQSIQEHANQLDIDNHQLTLRMKQLKALLEQRDQILKRLREKIQTIDHFESDDLLSILTENSSDNDFLSSVDEDIKKSNQHIHDLQFEITEKTRRIKELETLCKQEKDHSREMDTKLKVVLELRERDAHLHIRQLGQTDAELRKARTDTERVRILQQQLELKQQQLDDIQKVLTSEQIKFNEECNKLQHETHEKWMEVKRLTRDVDASKKECEGLRRQITKYANNERLSQEKSMMKPIPQHFGESASNGSSPVLYQQGENFRPIDHQRNDSGATSPAEMLIPRPPVFGISRPPFFHPPFIPPPPPNPFMMHPRFPMPTPGPHGMISPIRPLLMNGSDANSLEMTDSSNSAIYDAAVVSPVPDDEKSKKPKKSLKKKARTSAVKEEV